jgi:chorismate synthase
MSHNTFGHLFRVTTWGESHGPALGCVVDGCPPGLPLTEADIQHLARQAPPRHVALRHPAPGAGCGRKSCPACSRTTGRRPPSPPARADDREHRPALEGLLATSRTSFRPGHADYTYDAKYGVRDYRGGGRSSARETAARVAAGGVARKVPTGASMTIRGAGADRPASSTAKTGTGPVSRTTRSGAPTPQAAKRMGRLSGRHPQGRLSVGAGDRSVAERRARRPGARRSTASSTATSPAR